MADSGLRARYEDGTDLQARSGGLAPQQVVGFQSILVGGAVNVGAGGGVPRIARHIPIETGAAAVSAVGVPALGGFIRIDDTIPTFIDPGDVSVSGAIQPGGVGVMSSVGSPVVRGAVVPNVTPVVMAAGSPTVQKTFFFPSIYRYYDARIAPGGVDGGDVQTIPNLTSAGSARDASQPTLAARAIYRATAIGTPSWEFSGAQWYTLLQPRANPQLGTTVFALFRLKVASARRNIYTTIKGTRPLWLFCGDNNSIQFGVVHLGVASSTKQAMSGSLPLTTGLTVGGGLFHVVPPNAGTLTMVGWYQDGSVPGEGAQSSSVGVAVDDSSGHIQYIGTRNGSIEMLSAYLVALVEYDAFMSVDERKAVTGILNPSGPGP